MSDLEDDCSSASVPSILIDKNILTSTLTPRQNEDLHKMLNETENINENTYSTVIPGRSENKYNIFDETEHSKEYAEFELYVQRRSNIKQNFFVGNLSDEEKYCWTPDSSADDEPSIDEETPLYIFVQELPNGVIINSNVYLTTHQWNTIIIEEFIVCCILCEFYLTRNDIYKHIKSEEHKVLLETVKPLAKYDLSIVRKIREKYHCGVCNETFDIKDASDHTDLKSHEENLLFAINKVSDVLEFCGAENNDSNSSYESCDNDVLNNDNVINDDVINDDVINDDVINNDKYINDDIHYHVGDDDEAYISEWVITANNNPELSYANKLKLNSAPKDYDIELKNKKLKVSFNCWNMIAITRKNELYCMACKVFHPLNLKFQHCESAIHSENLKKCEIDNRFGDYFIRKVEHLYHCGHCNAIHPNIEDHLELKHPLKTKRTSENLLVSSQNIAEVKKVQKADDSQKVINDKVNNNSVNINDQVNNNNSVKVNDKSIKINDNATASTSSNYIGPDVFQNIVLNFFTYKISLPILNYNAIIKQYYNVDKFNYFCALCNIMWYGENIIPHTNTVHHIQMMQKTPFIAQFNCNMLRNINGMLHCALCNELINPILITYHIQHPKHLHNLRTSVFNNATPLINVNTNNDKFNPSLNTNNNDERKENPVPLKLNDETKTNEVASELNEDDETTENEANGEMNDSLNDTLESIIDLNAFVFVKLNNLQLKVTFTSYNTLVPKGDGNRYCFVCSSHVKDDEIKHHAESRSHVKNMDDCHFIDSFEGVPIRQMYLIYHCGICNVLIKRSNLKDHLDWPTHITEYENARKLSKKQRKVELKNGTPRITVKIDKEVIYNHVIEPESKILYAVLIVDKVEVEIKMYKMIILDALVLKVEIDSWNGIVQTKDCIRCIICQKEINDKETHVETEEHKIRVQHPFMKQRLEELLREINRNSYHCIVCNAEVSNLDDVVTKHVEGKKHKKNFETIKNFSSQTSSYDDCIEDVLQL